MSGVGAGEGVVREFSPTSMVLVPFFYFHQFFSNPIG